MFLRARDGEFDAIVTMYHDQGQIAIKLMGFSRGVTVQGGLPVADHHAGARHGLRHRRPRQGRCAGDRQCLRNRLPHGTRPPHPA